jgi:hypothetical protein
VLRKISTIGFSKKKTQLKPVKQQQSRYCTLPGAASDSMSAGVMRCGWYSLRHVTVSLIIACSRSTHGLEYIIHQFNNNLSPKTPVRSDAIMENRKQGLKTGNKIFKDSKISLLVLT